MSVSASNETRFAVLQAADLTTAGGEETVSLDATEDRRITGLTVLATDYLDVEEFNAQADVYLGTRPTIPLDTNVATGDLDFFIQTFMTKEDDATNQLASDNSGPFIWDFSDQAPIEWKDQSTLSLTASSQATDNVGVMAIIEYEPL